MSTVVRIEVTTADGSPLDLATAARTVLPDGTIVYAVANGATFTLSELPEFGGGDVWVESFYIAQSPDAVARLSSGNLVGEGGAADPAQQARAFRVRPQRQQAGASHLADHDDVAHTVLAEGGQHRAGGAHAE